MANMLLLIGLPGSGKSSYAKIWLALHPGKALRINYDDLRIELYGNNWFFNRLEEEAMKAQASIRTIDALTSGVDVIIDNTNLVESVRGRWKAIADRCGATYSEYSLLNTPVQTCIARDASRPGSTNVGRAVIERMALWNGLLRFDDRRDKIIVDMDGTLADCEHRRIAAMKPLKHKSVGDRPSQSPSMACPNEGRQFEAGESCPACFAKPKMNWDIFYRGCENDPVIRPIMELTRLLAVGDCCAVGRESCEVGHGHFHYSYTHRDIIVVSGRPIDKAGKATEAWLTNNATFPYAHLLMRNGGDSRPDYEVKGEILDKMISSGLDLNRIKYVIDDRNQVVSMWRGRGLTCLQVNEGDF